MLHCISGHPQGDEALDEALDILIDDVWADPSRDVIDPAKVWIDCNRVAIDRESSLPITSTCKPRQM